MKRDAILGAAAAVLAGTLAFETPPVANASAQRPGTPKKKAPDKVDAALWGFVATNRNGKQIRFRYRAEDLTLYDPDSNANIGKSEPIKAGLSRVTFNDKSKFPAVFEIHKLDGPNWKGQASYEGDTCTIDLHAIIR